MKLKKIASLALAGIMAVSMLAGCNGSTEPTDPENPIVPVASNAVEYAKDALDAGSLDVSVVSDTTLDGWAKAIATDVKKLPAQDISDYYDDTTKNANHSNMSNELRNKLKEQGPVVAAGANFKSMPSNGYSQSCGWMYAVSGQLDEKAAVNKAMKLINGYLKDDCATTVTNSSSDIYDSDYTLKISTLKVKNSSDNDKTAWVVAVVLTQNLTKATNTQV